MEQKITSPKYQQIAADIASKIVAGRYKVGEKVYARSSLAGQYSVSPETARRAINVLSDLGIVEIAKGSGVIIQSYENAAVYVKQFQDVSTINNLKKELSASVFRQQKEMDYFKKNLSELMDKLDRYRSINPFTPFEILITEECICAGKTIADLNFWHHTGATILAIKRGNELLISPGPYAVLQLNDVVYFLGNDNCLECVHTFLYK